MARDVKHFHCAFVFVYHLRTHSTLIPATPSFSPVELLGSTFPGDRLWAEPAEMQGCGSMSACLCSVMPWASPEGSVGCIQAEQGLRVQERSFHGNPACRCCTAGAGSVVCLVGGAYPCHSKSLKKIKFCYPCVSHACRVLFVYVLTVVVGMV